ncbi:PLP-dependent aminotransferase family protein [Paenibacillus caui]|uniref:aminotransferase-like domain-containing protein n=1 Tax=Paenibacillus caui TaxID=2873927 RepID=UPI001CA91620
MKYEKLIASIKEKIMKGEIKSGGKMPSIRELCSTFGCSSSTAVRAYASLKEEGWVYAVEGSGYYLIGGTKAEPLRSSPTDWSGTTLDAGSLPYSEFEPCVSQALGKYKDQLFTYSDPQGLYSLREAIRKHLQDVQVFCEADRVFVTTGSQQALNLLAAMDFPSGKIHVAVEQPTYSGMLRSLNLNRINAIGVARDTAGLDMNGLENIFRSGNVKFFYTVSRYSNPLGLSYGKEEKLKMLELAEKYDVFIVEDDYLGGLDNSTKSPPIYALDSNDRVIYVQTFSKLLLPGLRIAAVVLPRRLIPLFAERKYWSDLGTPLLSQGALEIYLNSGMYSRHLKRIRRMYAGRMALLRSLSARIESPAVSWTIPEDSGFYACARLQGPINEPALREALGKRDILISNMQSYYLPEFYDEKMIRVSIANLQPEAMEAGFAAIVQEAERNRTISRTNIWQSHL